MSETLTGEHELWASLPEELAHKIVGCAALCWDSGSWRRSGRRGSGPLERVHFTTQFDCVLQFRRLSRAFAAGLWPVALCMVPVAHRYHGRCFVEGVVRQALQGMTSDRYSFLYTIVYEGCTMKPPNNRSQYYYDLLAELRPTLEKLLGNGGLSQQERRFAVGLLRSIFKYIDRFFVKRNGLTPVAELIAEAFGYHDEDETHPASQSVLG